MLFPLSFLLMIKNKKYNNVLWQTIIVFPLIILIEVLQGVTHTGVFDIDDIFLNIIGGILGYYFYRLLTFLLNKTFLKKYKETLCNVGMILIMIIVLIYMGV